MVFLVAVYSNQVIWEFDVSLKDCDICLCDDKVRQLQLSSKIATAKNVAKVAEDYLKGDKSSADDSRENACMLVSGSSKDESEEKWLYHELLKELDACMLAYFSFHWNHASALLEHVGVSSMACFACLQEYSFSTTNYFCSVIYLGLCQAVVLWLLSCVHFWNAFFKCRHNSVDY